MYERLPNKGLGWSDVHETPSPFQWLLGSAAPVKMCLENAGGQQRCFAESEIQTAIGNNCQRMSESCGTGGPAGNQPGSVWCCQPGIPSTDSSLNPGYVASVASNSRALGFLAVLAASGVIWFLVRKIQAGRVAEVAVQVLPWEGYI